MSESTKRNYFPQVEMALSACDSHLSSGALVSPPIQSLLTQAILLLISGEFERNIRSQIKKRCSGTPDAIVAKFVESAADHTIKRSNFKIEDLAGLLGHFDTAYKKAFQSRLDKITEDQHDSLIYLRNQIAHGEDTTPTLAEVRKYYFHTQRVLDHFRYALFGGVDDAAGGGDRDR